MQQQCIGRIDSCDSLSCQLEQLQCKTGLGPLSVSNCLNPSIPSLLLLALTIFVVQIELCAAHPFMGHLFVRT